MLEASARRIGERVGEDQLVLDVGGWARPFPRADWVVDLQPYETRGLYHYDDRDRAAERFTADTWVMRDICAREPWPFADRQFDFVICAQTLEDVRDPVWVCAELVRVARAGYVEVPSRLEEQSLGVDPGTAVARARAVRRWAGGAPGAGCGWAGWSHHRWLCDVEPGRIVFVHKPHFLHARAGLHFPARFGAALSEQERVATLWWEGGFDCAERVFVDGSELDAYLEEPVRKRLGADARGARRGLARLRGG